MAFNISKTFTITTAKQVPYVPPAGQVVIHDPYFSSVSFLQGNSTGSGAFTDSSTDNLTITPSGVPGQGPNSPFTGSGGSVFFGGSVDYLTTVSTSSFDWNSGASDFTVECWVNMTSLGSPNFPIWGTSNSISNGNTVLYAYPSGKLELGRVGINGTGSAAGVITTGSWHHIAVVRTTGNSTTAIYVNGVSVMTSSLALWSSGASPLYIGKWANGSVQFNGYMSNLHVLRGTARYTASFTPPTAPLTAITNTKLLLKFENAKFFDVKRISNVGIGGTADYSSTSPYTGSGNSLNTSGATGGSGYGTGYLMMKDGKNPFAFGTGDFTVEYWYRLNNIGGSLDQALVDCRPVVTQGNYFAMYKVSAPNKLFSIINGATWISGSATVAANTWYHVAFSRVSGTSRLFINGVLDGTKSDSLNYLTGPVNAIGSFNDGSGSMNGNISDFRVTKGIGRYTASFTLPTGSYPTS